MIESSAEKREVLFNFERRFDFSVVITQTTQ